MTELSYWENPYPTFARLHAEGPVHYSDDLQSWVVTGHAEAQAALSHDGLSSDWLRTGPAGRLEAPVLNHVRDWLMWSDPPAHGAARTAVTSLFTRRSVQARAGLIQEHIADRYAAFVAAGGGDVVTGFAVPGVTALVAAVVGLPGTSAEVLQGWSRAAGALMARPYHAPTVAAAEQALADLDTTVRERPAGAGATVVGRAGDADVQRLASLFAFAGIETTSQAVTRLVDRWAAGAIDPAWPASEVVDELLRHDTPVPQVPRIAVRDLELAGRSIAAGDPVVIILAAANRDERRFPEPGRLCPQAASARHLSYGHGRHRCLGAGLAHEVLTAVATELGRHPSPRPVGGAEWLRDRGYRAIGRLEVRFGQP